MPENRKSKDAEVSGDDVALSPSNANSRESCKEIWSKLSSDQDSLGLGERRTVETDNKCYAISDIPLAAQEANPTFDSSDSKFESASTSSSPGSTMTSRLHGVVFLDVVSASNLPKLHNVTRTGFDMDPFVIISFGKYIFRTRHIRHKLNPQWRAKLMFKVFNDQTNFVIKYSVHDWDKMSGNDRVGQVTMEVSDLIQAAVSNEDLSVYFRDSDAINGDSDPEMTEYNIKINLDSNIKIPTTDAFLKINAKFVPLETLRKRFWIDLGKAYDPDNFSGMYDKVLIQTMLESLGSNLSSHSLDQLFESGRDPGNNELTFDEMFNEIEGRLNSQGNKRISLGQSPQNVNYNRDVADENQDEQDDADYHLVRKEDLETSSPQALDIDDLTEDDFDPQNSETERIVKMSTCPFCHDSGLGHKPETDIITHLAICSSNKGYSLDKLILGNFVTEAHAQRKWITKVVKSFGYGRYVIGRSNANIIVQDRVTGALIEEKMPTFIRLGIRLLYKSPAHKIHVTKILRDMSVKQGKKFNDPKSKKDIEPFIKFHKLEPQMHEVLDPISSFKNFNEFFYRKLKPTARTLDSPGNDNVAVSVADCRMTCFPTISDATKFWIKGREFTIARLLDDESLAKRFEGGSLAIFRLAPQDYHRYHIPVKGILSEPKLVEGEYYTVNPMAIRSKLDVYGENKRMVSTIESLEFGSVAYVAIGAMMVGSIVITSQPGQEAQRMDEHGFFAFGGSTIVLLFEPNSIQFDHDLVRSSKEQIEMLIKVGMRVGISTRT
ncbi:hypothetical protein BGZ76_004549 [Entomortierella beljakovae]|nr:hypothetical protein BGZ76_004549 [Entomortierella beljakovae]